MKRITSLLLSLMMLFTLCSPVSAAALDVTDEENLSGYEVSDTDAAADTGELIQAASSPSGEWGVKFYISPSMIAYFKDFNDAWKAVVVDGKFLRGKTTIGEGRFQLPDEFKFVMSKPQTVTMEELTVNDGVTVNIVVAPFTSGGASRPEDIAHTFNSGITVKSGGSLNFVSDMLGYYPENVTITFGGPIKVEAGGSLTMESVDPTTDSNSTVYQLSEEAEGSLLEVEAEATATLTDVKLTSDSDAPVISASGSVTMESGIFSNKVTEVSNTGAAPAIEVKGDGQLTVNADENNRGQLAISSTGEGQPAIKVEENASLTLPKNPDAKITTENNDGKAIDLAGGAKVQQGGNTITVAPVEDESASNYVDNFGNVVLTSGGKNDKGDIPANTVIQPDGTAITGNNGVLPEVGDNGNVTLPSGGATITNPDGDKVDVGNGEKIPSIVIGVKDAETGKVETSKSIKLGDGTLTLEPAVFNSEINFDEYTCTSVTSNPANIVTTELQENGTVLVTPVSTGTATITATYAKDNGAAESIALLDEGEATADDTLTATFNVTVEKESSGGGGGGGSSSSTTYAVSVEDSKNGSVSVSPKRAEKGDTVTITVKPDTGYELDELTVTDKNGDKIKLTEKDDNKFTFKMPGSKVTVETSFKLIETEPENPFTDISKNDYFYDAVLWAADKGITSGVTDTLFAPNSSCTRAQMVTFLWRANGSPVVDYAMNFTDVPADAYYADAVRWAVSKGITSGTSATTFAPDMTVTRSQTVTFLYRAAGTPSVSGGSFADVDANAYYADAVAWAVSEGITSGTSATTFSPDAACTRGQIVTFLYRAQ